MDDFVVSALSEMAGRLNDRRAEIATYRDYYAGRQRVQFAGEQAQSQFGKKLERLTCNRCAGVVDALADRLQVMGFTEATGDTAVVDAIWQANGMDLVQGDIHQEALTTGDAYLLIWPDLRTGAPVIYPHPSDRMSVVMSAENPRVLEAGLKVWRQRDGRWRANLYFADRLEKYVTKAIGDDLPIDQRAWDQWQDEADLSWPIPYDATWAGTVPVFRFANNASMGDPGRSELRDIIPLQDRYNQTLANLAVTEEHQSFRQRWATGIQLMRDPDTGKVIPPFRAGPGDLWTSTSEATKFGDFDAADMRQFLDTAEGWEMRIARTSRVPMHYLMMTGSPPSGEALKTAEAPFVAKIKDRQRAFGSTWAAAMRFAARIAGADVDLTTVWQSAETRSDRDYWELAQARRDRGISDQAILREWGYTDEEIAVFAQEIAEGSTATGDALAQAFNRGTAIG